MSINERIEELLKQSPGLRTIQIADKLDLPIQPVVDTLAEMGKTGLIRYEEVDAPNGRKATAYWLVSATVVGSATAAAVVPNGTRRTHADRVIDFIASQSDQSATSAQLHQLLGLKSTEYASSYLGGAVRDGRLVKDGKTWKLGPALTVGTVPVQAGTADTAASALPIPTFLPAVAENTAEPAKPAKPARANPMAALVADAQATTAAIAAAKTKTELLKIITPKAQQPEAAPAAPAPVVPAQAEAPAYRCALWSDGILEVCRNGETVAEMEQAAGESLAAFLARLIAERKAA